MMGFTIKRSLPAGTTVQVTGRMRCAMSPAQRAEALELIAALDEADELFEEASEEQDGDPSVRDYEHRVDSYEAIAPAAIRLLRDLVGTDES